MIREVPGRRPRIDPDAYVDPQAAVIGNVDDRRRRLRLALRGAAGRHGQLRDARPELERAGQLRPARDRGLPCIVGDNVTIGHRAVVHACRVMNNVRIGIGAIVLDGAVIEEGAQVGAGALVPPGKVVPAGWLVMGVPAKPVRKMDAAELEDILKNARDYVALWRRDYR